MPLINRHLINIDPIHKPPPLAVPISPQNQVIPGHHPLPHLPLLIERPILQPVAPFPLPPILTILILVPELHSDAVLCERE